MPHLFAQLSTGDRIVQPLLYRDRTLLIALAILLVLTTGGGLSQIPWYPDETPSSPPPKERIGQNEQSISVEIVTEAVPDAKAEMARAGEAAPPAPPQPPLQLPEPAETQTEAEAETKPKPEPPKKPEKADKPEQKPLTVDDFDVSMADVVQAVEQAEAERKRRKAQPRTADASQVQAAGARGRTTPFSKAVYSALSVRWPPPVALVPGTATVVFQIERDGSVKQIRFLRPSGNKLFDQQVIDAIKTSRLPVPPATVDPAELVIQIEYTLSEGKR